jgi:hypothetical protein
MEIETLGMARSLGWKAHMRCAHGYRAGTKSIRNPVYPAPALGARLQPPVEFEAQLRPVAPTPNQDEAQSLN